MNKKTRRKRAKKFGNEVERQLIIDMSSRSIVKIEQEQLNIDKDLERYRKELEEISRMVEKKYYSQNTTIDNVLERRFWDLLKIFLKNIKANRVVYFKNNEAI